MSKRKQNQGIFLNKPKNFDFSLKKKVSVGKYSKPRKLKNFHGFFSKKNENTDFPLNSQNSVVFNANKNYWLSDVQKNKILDTYGQEFKKLTYISPEDPAAYFEKKTTDNFSKNASNRLVKTSKNYLASFREKSQLYFGSIILNSLFCPTQLDLLNIPCFGNNARYVKGLSRIGIKENFYVFLRTKEYSRLRFSCFRKLITNLYSPITKKSFEFFFNFYFYKRWWLVDVLQ